MNVGFVGLGVMGSAMSGHLIEAGFPVVGYDVDPRRIQQHRERGGIAAASVRDVCERCELVVTSLPSVSAFAEVVRDLGDDVTVVETSTLPLEAKLEARRRLGARLLDCPLSGTGEQARSRDLVVFLSGDDAAAKRRAGVVLDAVARSRYDVGEFGNGTKLKIVANLLVAVHNLASAEGLLLARRAGLDPEVALRAVADGAGSSRMLEVRGPAMLAGEYEPAAMRVELFRKDLDIIASFARSVGSPTPLFSVCEEFYDAAIQQGRGQQDTSCVFAVLDAVHP